MSLQFYNWLPNDPIVLSETSERTMGGSVFSFHPFQLTVDRQYWMDIFLGYSKATIRDEPIRNINPNKYGMLFSLCHWTSHILG